MSDEAAGELIYEGVAESPEPQRYLEQLSAQEVLQLMRYTESAEARLGCCALAGVKAMAGINALDLVNGLARLEAVRRWREANELERVGE